MEKFFDFVRQLTFLSKESEDALSAVLQKMELPKGHRPNRQKGTAHAAPVINLDYVPAKVKSYVQ